MLALQKQAKYFSQIVTLPNGERAFVVFELVDRGGQMIAKAIYAEKVETESIPEQQICALPGCISYSSVAPVKSTFGVYVSPFFRDFSFFTSQLTRAPSF
jgi:hypothetical protein